MQRFLGKQAAWRWIAQGIRGASVVGGLLIASWLMMGKFAIAAPMPTPATDTTPGERVLVQQQLQQLPPGFYGLKDIETLRRKINQNTVVLIDVRQPSEYRSGHIDGAINIPLRSLADRSDEIPQDRPVVLYCSTGYRTGLGVMALHLLGYDNVQGFPPSYEGWKQANGAT